MKPKIRRWLVILAAIAFLFGAYETLQPNTYSTAPDDKPEEDEIGSIIDKLIACESGGRADAIHRNDGNTGLDSIGILQYQLPTFKEFALRFNVFPYAEAAELENMWRDSESQIKVTREAIRGDRKNLRHWYICSKKYNFI